MLPEPLTEVLHGPVTRRLTRTRVCHRGGPTFRHLKPTFSGLPDTRLAGRAADKGVTAHAGAYGHPEGVGDRRCGPPLGSGHGLNTVRA